MDAAAVVDRKLRRHFVIEDRLAAGGETRDFPLMPVLTPPERDGRGAIGAPDAVDGVRPKKFVFAAEEVFNSSVAEQPCAVVDVIPAAIRRVEQRVVPSRMEKAGQSVRFVVIVDMQRRVFPDAEMRAEFLLIQDGKTVSGPGALGFPLEGFEFRPPEQAPQPRFRGAPAAQMGVQLRRKGAAREGDGVDVAQPDAADAQAFRDRLMRRPPAIGFNPRDAFKRDGGDQAVAVIQRRRSVMPAVVYAQEKLWHWLKSS